MRPLFLFFAFGLTLAACNNSKPEQDLSIAPLKSTTTDNTNNYSAPANQNLPKQMPALPNNSLTQTQSALPQSVQNSTSAVGMNPAHGKPGHKCEIAVGAPLNSAPAKTAIAPTTITQPTSISQPAITQPAKTITAKGMNPAHGKPGHRCDISVGAPLNSAPTAAKLAATNGAANITQMASPTQNSSIVPALQNTSISTPAKTASAFTGKINPAHGQPGHDCKVAVGQPLP